MSNTTFVAAIMTCAHPHGISEADVTALGHLFLEELGWGESLIQNWAEVVEEYGLEPTKPKTVSFAELVVRVIDCTCGEPDGTSREALKAVVLFIAERMQSHITVEGSK